MGIGKRIKEAREAARVSQAALAGMINQAQTTISSWERGRTEPSREDVARIADALHLSAADLEGGNIASDPVAVVGYVGAGAVAVLFSEGQGPFDYVEPPRQRAPSTVGLGVRGVSLGPAFDNGWVFYDDVRSPVTEDLHGRLCVVGLTDGRVLVKILKPATGGRFHLLSNTAEPPLLDEEVQWAARVKEVRPN
jgi:transcriptional regulator with XRE-family HTH domain